MIAEIVTNEEVAAALGVHVRTVQGYIKRRGGKPFDDIDDARRWQAENVNNNGPPTIGERAAGLRPDRIPRDKLDEEETRARIRKLDAEAEAKELKNAIARGELYDGPSTDLQVAELCGLIRARLESVPQELENEWPAETRQYVTERLRDRIYLILTEMSQWRLER